MRALYSLSWWLLLPLVLLRLWWRGRQQPGYRRDIGERFGFYRAPVAAQGRTIWIHAVSVGETRAAQPLLESLLAAYPECVILLTHMTPTGRAAGRDLYARHGERVVQSYLPYDTGHMVDRFLDHFQPRICVLMETEIWPNLIARCSARQVPVVVANARLSERSLRRAQRFSGLMREAVRGITCVAAQTEADAARIRQLGMQKVQVTGSIKFDVTPPEHADTAGGDLRRRFGARPVLLCASTRDKEETLILDALRTQPLQVGAQQALVVIVPRHPQRFERVAQEIAEHGFAMQRRSQLGTDGVLDDTVQVLLGDSMGEMFTYYAACDLAFIGGSLVPLGGQNLIEACALGKPVLIGQHTFNFATISDQAVAAGAAVRVADARALLEQAAGLLRQDGLRAEMGAKALEFAKAQRGATVETMRMLEALLD